MSTLRSRLSRLAHTQPQLRLDLLPLLRSAGEVIPFRRPDPKPGVPKIRINGREYVLSNYWPTMGLHGGAENTPADESEFGARVIRPPAEELHRHRYFWAYDTEKQYVAMWRVSDWDEKAGGHTRHFVNELRALNKLGQLNQVTHQEMEALERFARTKQQEHLREMQQSIKENESQFQKLVNQGTLDLFNRVYRPKIDAQLKDAARGVVPISFEYRPTFYKSKEDQMRNHIVGEVLHKDMTLDKVEAYLKAKGLDVANSRDFQAASWALNDVRFGIMSEYAGEGKFSF